MKSLKAYACYNTDRYLRLSSSSGAVFSSLAEFVFEQNGVVYGVAMSEDCYSAEFISVTNREGLLRLRGSKYMQAKVGDTFKKVKEDLLSGKIVLFTGTGCQVNGLKAFLNRNYENLICVDVICHGVPSPALWKKYVLYQEEKNGGKLKWINFRCKDESWTNFGMKEAIEDISKKSVKRLYISKDRDSYMQMFLKDFCLRPSCYECVAKKVNMSDLSIADFWGINDIAPEMNDEMGTSLVLIRTGKGQNIFDYISSKRKLKEVSYEDGVKYNPAEFKSCTRPPQRETFFCDMHKMSFEELKNKYENPIEGAFYERVKRKAKNMIKSIVYKVVDMRYVCGGGKKSNVEYGLLFVFYI